MRRAGDLIIDHYFPHADDEVRELARQRLRALAEVIYDACEHELEDDTLPDSQRSPRTPIIDL